MRPTWLIEAGVYGDEADGLLVEVRRQGMVAALLPYAALRKGAAPTARGRALEPGACAIGYGTFPFARQIQLHHQWVPGAWCNPDALDFAAYARHFPRYLLNQHHVVLTGVEAIRQRDVLFDALGAERDEVFVRPTACDKLFVGRRVDRESFAAALGPARYDPVATVVVAPVRKVRREWRLVVVWDRVVAGSQYAVDGRRDVRPELPADVRAFAEAVLAAVPWRPDPVFMFDVGDSDGALWIVELNGFSTSWLYAADLPTVVRDVSTLAARASGPGGVRRSSGRGVRIDERPDPLHNVDQEV